MSKETPAMKGALMVIVGNPEHFTHGFEDWVIENWPIWRRFELEAFEVIKSGRKHYSARRICESIRHETALRESGGEWKLDNRRIPDLARLFGLIHPSHANLFEYRGNEHRATFRAQAHANMASGLAA